MPNITNTTIANHNCRQRKWPPSAPHEALSSALAQRMDRRQPPKWADILFGAVTGVYGPQNTPMLWQFIIARALWGSYTPSTTPKITSVSLGGCKLFIQSIGVERKASCGAQGGHFCWRQPWLWRLWCQLCYVIRLLKISIIILKQVVCNQCLYVLLYIVKHIIIHVSLVVAWPSPSCMVARAQTTFVKWTPAYWISPESSCHCDKDSHIVLRPKSRNNHEREKRLSTSYLELLIILDFWLFKGVVLMPWWFLCPVFYIRITWRNLEGYPAQPGLTWRNLEGYPDQPGLTWRNLEGYPAQPGLICFSIHLSKG